MVNGKNSSRSTITLYSYNCLEYCPEEEVGPGGGESCEGIRYWSVASDWDNNKVPEENDDVIIRSNCVYIFDVYMTPVLQSVTVYGTLIWKNNATDLSLTMNTRLLYNRGGTI